MRGKGDGQGAARLEHGALAVFWVTGGLGRNEWGVATLGRGNIGGRCAAACASQHPLLQLTGGLCASRGSRGSRGISGSSAAALGRHGGISDGPGRTQQVLILKQLALACIQRDAMRMAKQSLSKAWQPEGRALMHRPLMRGGDERGAAPF